MFEFKLDKAVIRKILRVIKAGLVGDTVGSPEPGQMCVESAVCYALGLEHSDQTHQHECVGKAVNDVGIALNDMDWSSDEARAEGMKRFAVAQMGSNIIDQEAFTEKVAGLGYGRLACEFMESPYPLDIDKQMLADRVVKILQDMKSPGCEYLDLCNEPTVPCQGKGCGH